VVGESGIRGGTPENPATGTTISFAKDGKVILKEGKEGRSMEGTYTADPKKEPAEIDIVPPATEKGPTLQAIYKIDGNTLTMCFSMDVDRPKTFDSSAGSKTMLVSCRCVKKD
jgi:uncharacterized protein (TIGR03067 family)